MEKYVYLFSEGDKNMRELLGGKGANLAEMIKIGLPVPNGFTVTTETCNKYYDDGETISSEVENQIMEKLHELENLTGKKFGDPHNPLLVSVRSGARASMPGMMDTVLNLGLNDEVVKGFAESTNNPRFAYDSYRRFIQMFSDVVKDYPKSSFERFFDQYKEERGIHFDTEINADQMMEVVEHFKQNYFEIAKEEFPQDPKEQLLEAVKAVFRSWNNERAIIYRRMNDIPGSWGTAVNIQEMVYGNRGDDCGTGVAFTRNPSTGENKLYGEYLINAQGEDVVAGIRTPEDISTLEVAMPEVYKQFVDICDKLEHHYKDMQDMEFTIERGKLFMLQTRNGKRTSQAALRIAKELVEEGMITKEQAVLSIDPKQLDSLLHPMFNPEALKNAKALTTALAASPGAATGQIYFTAEEAVEAHKQGKEVILVRLETSPEDIEGMHSSNGILTLRGGMTSHAAVVARGMGTCCVSGAGELKIDEENKVLSTKDGLEFHEGDWISLDGSTGRVYGEKIATQAALISGDFETIMSWTDEFREMKVRTNADTPKDAKKAREFGAEGIGLCRTEHMFFEGQRIMAMREMILADTLEQREKALEKLLPMQRGDFEEIFKAMAPYAVTIRYLDPPLHEFLPHTEEEMAELAKDLGMTVEHIKARVTSLAEVNPMMGHRGLRLAVTYPEIAKMQTRAVIEAAINVNKEGLNVVPEIMIPLACDVKELKYVTDIVHEVANKLIKESGVDLKYMVGTMIEIPRAALTANKLAEQAEFFSFGTNDLTQMTYGFSRDDAGKFLDDYYRKQIFESDPFARLDQEGVGELVKTAIERGKQTRPNVKLGICGEHGGDPTTVEFCYNAGLNYVSCSPFRVPIARLAAAQANLKNK